MQVQKINNQPIAKTNSTSFKGTFTVKDSRVLNVSKDYSEELYLKLVHIKDAYFFQTNKDSVFIKSLPANDVAVFKKINELGLKFGADISKKFVVGK